MRELDRGELTFHDCWRYRLGATNDEGWFKKQSRFSLVAPEWGLFYEVRGDLGLHVAPNDWILLGRSASGNSRHFLFYFRDETFECDAMSWSFRSLPGSDVDFKRWRSAQRIAIPRRRSSAGFVASLFGTLFWVLPRRIRAWIRR